MRKIEKRGVSPIIATVMLIGIVVVVGLIVFLWFKGLTKETETKFGTENIDIACTKVEFTAQYSNGQLSISNGNVPIFDFDVREITAGGYTTEKLSDLSSSWPDIGLKANGVFGGSVNVGGASEISLIPILLGKVGSEKRTHSCGEQYGYNVIVG